MEGHTPTAQFLLLAQVETSLECLCTMILLYLPTCVPSSKGHGQYVAGKCECRPEYAGLDCEKCADGYVENKNGNSFTCVLDTNNTKPGYCRKDTCGCIYKGSLCVTPLGTCDDSTGKVLCTCNASLHVQGARCGEVWMRLPPFRVLAICVVVTDR